MTEDQIDELTEEIKELAKSVGLNFTVCEKKRKAFLKSTTK